MLRNWLMWFYVRKLKLTKEMVRIRLKCLECQTQPPSFPPKITSQLWYGVKCRYISLPIPRVICLKPPLGILIHKQLTRVIYGLSRFKSQSQECWSAGVGGRQHSTAAAAAVVLFFSNVDLVKKGPEKGQLTGEEKRGRKRSGELVVGVLSILGR